MSKPEGKSERKESSRRSGQFRGNDPGVSPRKGIGRKPDFLPLITEAFVEKGYRRATTSQLATCCNVRENELYRIWPNKRAMFLDSIQYVYDISVQEWTKGFDAESEETIAEQLIARQATYRGDSRLHRIVFSGLNEVDDPEIRRALKKLYNQFHQLLAGYVAEHRRERGIGSPLDDDAIAWAMIGLGSIFDIQHDLGIGSIAGRRQMLGHATTEMLNMTRPENQ